MNQMFEEYPDVVSTKQLQSMLGLSKNSVLELLHNNEIRHFRKGRKYLIPKLCVIEFISNKTACAHYDKDL